MDFSLTYVSPNVQGQTGFSADEYLKTTLEQRFPPESIQKIQDIVESATLGELPEETNSSLVELQSYRANGSTYWSQVSYNFMRDDSGRITGFFGICHDSTNRKQRMHELLHIQTEIQQSEQKYRELYSLVRLMADTMPDMLWAKDLERKYIFANKAICEKLLGAESIDEPLGKTDMFFAERQRTQKPDDPTWHTFGEVCRDSDSITLEAMRSMSFEESGNIRGQYTVFDVRKAPIIDEAGNLIGVVGSGRDVTEQIAMQQALQRESAFRNLIMEISAEFLKPVAELSDPNIYDSLVKVAEFWSADRAYIFDYHPETGMCSNQYEWCREGFSTVFVKHTDAELLPDWRAAFAGGKMFHVPNVSELEAGSTKAIQEQSGVKSLISLPLLNGNECFGFIGFDMLRDYYHYSEIDLHLLQVFAEMLANLRLRKLKNLELIAAKDKALESDRIKSSFLANMSHELRTPLNGILGFSELLTNSAKTIDNKEMATMIFSSGKRLLRTLDMILDISRIEANKLDIRLQNFDLCRKLQHTLKLYLPLAELKGISLNYVPRINPLNLSSDPDIFNRIMDELVYNAIKYTFEGGITITTDQISHNNRSCIEIQISDTGIGIPEDRVKIIFQAFRQASEGLSRNHEGTGLGLTLCQKYASILEGEIRVISKPDVGSTFSLILPQLSADNGEASTAEVIHAQKDFRHVPNARILLIDDDELGRFLTARQMPQNLTLDTAQNGRQGLTFLQERNYDLLLLDINLKDNYSGIDLLMDIRKIPKLKKLPVIALTAYAMTGDRERFLSIGFDGYISKPVSHQQLLKIMLKHLRK